MKKLEQTKDDTKLQCNLTQVNYSSPTFYFSLKNKYEPVLFLQSDGHVPFSSSLSQRHFVHISTLCTSLHQFYSCSPTHPFVKLLFRLLLIHIKIADSVEATHAQFKIKSIRTTLWYCPSTASLFSLSSG